MSNSTVKESLTVQALELALEALEDAKYFIESELNDRMDLYKNYPNLAHKYAGEQESLRKNQDAITAIKEALAQPEQERCVGCEACIDTACGRDECPKGWPKALQPEQEPVAWMLEGWGPDCGPYFEIYRNDEMGWRDKKEWTPLYTTPPQRKPLTDEEIGAILEGVNAYGTRLYTFARAIEAAHSIKGDA